MFNLKVLFCSVKFGELNTDADGKCDFKSNKQNAVVQLQELNENGKGKKCIYADFSFLQLIQDFLPP